MTRYNLKGSISFNHDEDYVADAIGIPDRWNPLLDMAKQAWDQGRTFSEKIEYLVSRLDGAELVLALILLGEMVEWSPSDHPLWWNKYSR
ncbi:MAG: hypothetical protein ACFFCO_07295 [Promethearchaeota archaeon]